MKRIGKAVLVLCIVLIAWVKATLGFLTIHFHQATLRWFGILLTCVLIGVMAGGFVYAPLHRSISVAVAASMIGGLIYAGLWIRQQRTARHGWRHLARRWAWGLGLTPFVMILGVVALALLQLYNMGQFSPLTQDRVANFDRFVRAVERAYPYFDAKQIDWQTRVATVRPQIEAAPSNEEYFHVVAALLVDLNDGHTMLSQPFVPHIQMGQMAEIEGQTVIVKTGPSAEAAGLRIGDVVLAVDGQDIEAAIANLPPQLRYGSTAWNRRNFALSNLLAVRDAAQSLSVTVQPANGGAYTVTLTPQPPSTVSVATVESQPLVQGERLASGIGYIHLGRNFGNRSGHDMLTEFDTALATLMDTPGLILDLRDNSGGSSLLANQIAGRFLAEPFVYGREYYRQRLPIRLWWLWSERRVTPRPPFYSGPLVLLMNATTVSSAEEFVVSLVDSGRAQTVGRQTGGSTGNPLTFQLPGGGSARFSTGDLRRIEGTRIEGVGISPDLPVTWTLDDVRQGRDPDLVAAEWLLLQ